jgi:lipid-A-disaccharide synthase
MIDEWRMWLYPLGFLSCIAFGGRFLIQWIISEIKQESVVTRSFWVLSLIGNILLMLHSLVQVQFHVCVIQATNTVISWRNLNLMQDKTRQISFQTTIVALVYAIFFTVLLFLLQGYFLYDNPFLWFRTPETPWTTHAKPEVPLLWHLMGFASYILFSSRFWIQWWSAEKMKASYFGPSFWWISVLGTLSTLVYFALLRDYVNLIGPAVGLIPSIRNLMLIQKVKVQV